MRKFTGICLEIFDVFVSKSLQCFAKMLHHATMEVQGSFRRWKGCTRKIEGQGIQPQSMLARKKRARCKLTKFLPPAPLLWVRVPPREEAKRRAAPAHLDVSARALRQNASKLLRRRFDSALHAGLKISMGNTRDCQIVWKEQMDTLTKEQPWLANQQVRGHVLVALQWWRRFARGQCTQQ